jgi:hypothetical protein
MARIEPDGLIAIETSPIRAIQTVSQAEKPARETLVQGAEPGILADRHFVWRSGVTTVEALRVSRRDEQKAGNPDQAKAHRNLHGPVMR